MAGRLDPEPLTDRSDMRLGRHINMGKKKFVVAKIVIKRVMTGKGGDTIWAKAQDEAGEPLALVTALGMLRMTEDTLIRMDRDEIPEDAARSESEAEFGGEEPDE